jgi:hypothetical protein
MARMVHTLHDATRLALGSGFLPVRLATDIEELLRENHRYRGIEGGRVCLNPRHEFQRLKEPMY